MTKSKWKNKNPLGNESLVGITRISRRASDLVNLLTLELGVSKSQVLRDFIDKGLPATEAEINKTIANIACHIVQTFIFEKSPITFPYYRLAQKTLLKKRGISNFFVNRIIQEVSKQYATHKKSLKQTK